MTPQLSSRRKTTRTLCQSTREWVQLVLATTAGGAFIWQCLRPDSDMAKCGLLLFLCLTFFGRQTLLRQLLSILKPCLSGTARK